MFYRSICVDFDKMLHSGTSDVGLHCLPVSLLWDAKHKWFKVITVIVSQIMNI